MGIGIILSLGWFVLESCECDQSKENKFPGEWVACDGNTAVADGLLRQHSRYDRAPTIEL